MNIINDDYEYMYHYRWRKLYSNWYQYQYWLVTSTLYIMPKVLAKWDITKSWNGLENGLMNGLAQFHWKAIVDLFCRYKINNTNNAYCILIACNDALKASRYYWILLLPGFQVSLFVHASYPVWHSHPLIITWIMHSGSMSRGYDIFLPSMKITVVSN